MAYVSDEMAALGERLILKYMQDLEYEVQVLKEQLKTEAESKTIETDRARRAEVSLEALQRRMGPNA